MRRAAKVFIVISMIIWIIFLFPIFVVFATGDSSLNDPLLFFFFVSCIIAIIICISALVSLGDKSKRPSTFLSVLVLLFISRLAGIFMLCIEQPAAFPSSATYGGSLPSCSQDYKATCEKCLTYGEAYYVIVKKGGKPYVVTLCKECAKKYNQ